MNGAPNEFRCHSYRFGCLACKPLRYPCVCVCVCVCVKPSIISDKTFMYEFNPNNARICTGMCIYLSVYEFVLVCVCVFTMNIYIYIYIYIPMKKMPSLSLSHFLSITYSLSLSLSLAYSNSLSLSIYIYIFGGDLKNKKFINCIYFHNRSISLIPARQMKYVYIYIYIHIFYIYSTIRRKLTPG